MGRILIDGHNAMGALKIRGRTHEEMRLAVLRRVVEAAPGAVVYFDAREAPADAPRSRREHGVAVVYCRDREADTAILDAVRAADRAHDLLVVTNDREVAGRAKNLGAKASGVQAFFGAAPAPPQSGAAARDVELPRLKPEDFGLPDEVDLADPPPHLKGDGSRRRSRRPRRPER